MSVRMFNTVHMEEIIEAVGISLEYREMSTIFIHTLYCFNLSPHVTATPLLCGEEFFFEVKGLSETQAVEHFLEDHSQPRCSSLFSAPVRN